MVIRQIKKSHWEHVYRQITTFGRAAPLSLQFDIDLNCNGVDYILKIQPDTKRRIIILQALGVYPNGEGTGSKDYILIEDNVVLSALLEILVYQGADRHN